MNYLKIKNWEQFQHYKDRNPPWIKFHVCLLDDYEFSALPDTHKGHLVMLWLFASKNDGRIPADPRFLKNKLGLESDPDLDGFIESGWLTTDSEKNAPTEKWASRYINSKVREQLLSEASHKCKSCGGLDDLEIDHIVPVSKGGTSEADNLQVLCRPCNRRKRTRTTRYADAEQVATQSLDSSVALARSQESENKSYTKATETDARKSASDTFLKFWDAYPKKVAKGAAEKAWMKLKFSDSDVERIIAAVGAHAASEQWKRDEGAFIPHPATWLNQRRWEDEQRKPSASSSDLDDWMAKSGHGAVQ